MACLPRCRCPAKITPKAQSIILNVMKKNPWVKAKVLKESWELANLSFLESTICKTLNWQGIQGRTPWKKPLLSKENIVTCLKFAKEYLDAPQCFWENVLLTENIVGRIICEGNYVQAHYANMKWHHMLTWNQNSNKTSMVVGESWSLGAYKPCHL